MRLLDKIRSEVPALNQTVYGKNLVYFDNAATAHKPQSVVDLVNMMNSKTNSNVHRAVYKLSADATELYETAREKVREFINAPAKEQIIFTSGTTMSINLLANSFSQKFLKKGDVILVSQSEHHSNIVPWQLACERVGASISVIPLDENGRIDIDAFASLLSEKVKMVAVAQISNVLGVENPVKEIVEMAHKFGAQVLIDGAQGIVHSKVDVVDLDCDYYAFSGHKLYAETGTGILYGKRELLELLPPWMGGGDMVGTVSFAGTTYADLPLKFEAGTPNFIAASTLAPAIDFAMLMRDAEIEKNQEEMTKAMFKGLNSVDGLKIYGTGEAKIPLFSFSVEGVHHSDIAQIMDKMGVAVRSGLMCAEPLISSFGETGLVRASLAPYNTMEEVEYFFYSLNKVLKMLR